MAKKIYIASKFHSRYRLRPIKAELQSLGFEVLSKWMDVDRNVDKSADIDSLGNNIEDSVKEAKSDSGEIKNCDYFILDTQDETNTGGREVELGMALALNKRCFRIGPARNVFHFMCVNLENWPDAIQFLQMEEANEKA